MDFEKSFKNARRVSIPLVCIRSADPASTQDSVTLFLNGKAGECPLISWDAVKGAVGINDAGKLVLTRVILNGADQLETLNLARFADLAERSPRDTIVFVRNAHKFWSEPVVLQAVWNLRDKFKGVGAMLALLSLPGSNLPAELSNDVLVLDVPLPTKEQVNEVVTAMYAEAGLTEPDTETIERASDAVLGLPMFTTENSLAMSLTKKSGMDYSGLWDRKRQAIESTHGLTVYRGGETFSDIGGCENVKQFLTALAKGTPRIRVNVFWDELEKALAGTGTDSSGTKTEMYGTILQWMQDKDVSAVLFLGFPGAAKSAVSKAFGNEAGVPTVQMDIGGMQGKHVGESGENLRAGLRSVEAMAGHDGKSIMVIATVNEYASLPAPLRRRFTLGTFFFDLPTAEEQAAIWPIYLNKYKVEACKKTAQEAIVTGWTGAEIRTVCSLASRLNISLADASRYIVPVSVSASDQIKALRLQANGKFISASHPGVYTYQETASAPVVKGRHFQE